MKKLKVPHGTARALRRRDINRFRDQQRERAAQARLSTFSANLAPAQARSRGLKQERAITLTRGTSWTWVNEYLVDKEHPAFQPCAFRPKVHFHGLMTNTQALDWLATRS